MMNNRWARGVSSHHHSSSSSSGNGVDAIIRREKKEALAKNMEGGKYHKETVTVTKEDLGDAYFFYNMQLNYACKTLIFSNALPDWLIVAVIAQNKSFRTLVFDNNRLYKDPTIDCSLFLLILCFGTQK